MAGDWVPWLIGLTRKREVLAIAERTGRSRFEVGGLLAEFWGWLSIESRDCHVPSVTSKCLVGAVGGDEAFWDAVADVGWLKAEEASGIAIPHPERWNDRSAKARMLASLRKKRERESRHADVTPKSRRKRDTSTPTVTVTVTSSPPTPPGACGGGKAAPGNGTTEPEAEKAWALVLAELPRREPTVRNPGAYLATLRGKFAHPQEAGLKWWAEVEAEAERRDLRRRILAHAGKVFDDAKGERWTVDPSGGLETPAGHLQPIGTFKVEDLRRIAERLEAVT